MFREPKLKSSSALKQTLLKPLLLVLEFASGRRHPQHVTAGWGLMESGRGEQSHAKGSTEPQVSADPRGENARTTALPNRSLSSLSHKFEMRALK